MPRTFHYLVGVLMLVGVGGSAGAESLRYDTDFSSGRFNVEPDDTNIRTANTPTSFQSFQSVQSFDLVPDSTAMPPTGPVMSRSLENVQPTDGAVSSRIDLPEVVRFNGRALRTEEEAPTALRRASRERQVQMEEPVPEETAPEGPDVTAPELPRFEGGVQTGIPESLRFDGGLGAGIPKSLSFDSFPGRIGIPKSLSFEAPLGRIGIQPSLSFDRGLMMDGFQNSVYSSSENR